MAAHHPLPRRQLLVAVAAVAVGGAVGTLLRVVALRIDSTRWFVELVGTSGWATHVPWILALINVVGVYFAAAALNGLLLRRGPNDLGRLVIITGFFGGLTSYSSLFVSVGAIWHVSVWGAVFTVLCAVLSGVGAAWLGTRTWSR